MSITPEILEHIQTRLSSAPAPVPLYECRLYPHMPDAVLQRVRLADKIVSLTDSGVTWIKNGMTYTVPFPD